MAGPNALYSAAADPETNFARLHGATASIGIESHYRVQWQVQMRTLSRNARVGQSEQTAEKLASTAGFIETSNP